MLSPPETWPHVVRRRLVHDGRLVALQVEVDNARDRLQHRYKLVEDDLAKLDDLLQERITAVKADREKAQAALNRARQEGSGDASLNPEKSQPFPD
jgi:hypothetical protein